jgi:hypothetical protein
MKKPTTILIALLTVSFFACKKDNHDEQPPVQKKKLGYTIMEIKGSHYNSKDSVVYEYNTSGKVSMISTFTIVGGKYVPENEDKCNYKDTDLVSKVKYVFDGEVRKKNTVDSFIYDNHKIVKVIHLEFSPSNVIITSDTYTFTFDTDGRPIKKALDTWHYSEYTYSPEGNVLTANETASGTVWERTYQYDGKVNPYKNELSMFLYPEDYFSVNNVTKYTEKLITEFNIDYTYEYDSDNYPLNYTGTGSDEYIRLRSFHYVQ